MRKFLAFLLAVLLVSPVWAQSKPSKESFGTIGGMLLGGAVGSMFGGNAAGHVAGAIAGAAIGGFVGNRIGASLDKQDRVSLARATRKAMASGGQSSFSNKRTGVRGATRVTNTSKNASGQTCRTVEQEVVMKDGTVSRDTVTGCKGANGWSV